MSEVGTDVGVEEISKEDNKKKRLITWILLGVAVAAILIISVWRYQLATSISSNNAKVAGDIVDVSARLSGHLDRLLVNEQDAVKAGQVMAELDIVPFKAAYDQAKAALDLAQANYDKLPTDVKSMQAAYNKAQEGYASAAAKAKTTQVTLEDARRNLAQAEDLYKQGAVSKESLETARSKYNTAQANLQMEEANAAAAMAGLEDAEAKKESMKKTGSSIYIAQLKQAQGAFATARFNFENSTIKAPVSGTVVRVVVQAGENLAANQIILSICDLKNIWITANIDESKVSRVKTGQPADVRIDAYPGKIFKGKVEAISNTTQSSFSLLPTESSSGNYTKVMQRIPVKIAVINPDQVLKPGMSANIKIHTNK